MTTVTIPKKEYLGLKKQQREIVIELSLMKAAVLELVKNEVRPSVIKRLEYQSKILDKKKGKSFSSIGGFTRYLQTL